MCSTDLEEDENQWRDCVNSQIVCRCGLERTLEVGGKGQKSSWSDTKKTVLGRAVYWTVFLFVLIAVKAYTQWTILPNLYTT